MSMASACYLGCTVLLWILFAAIFMRTYDPKQKAKREEPKYRMMDDEEREL
jgi:hypothetical protein